MVVLVVAAMSYWFYFSSPFLFHPRIISPYLGAFLRSVDSRLFDCNMQPYWIMFTNVKEDLKLFILTILFIPFIIFEFFLFLTLFTHLRILLSIHPLLCDLCFYFETCNKVEGMTLNLLLFSLQVISKIKKKKQFFLRVWLCLVPNVYFSLWCHGKKINVFMCVCYESEEVISQDVDLTGSRLSFLRHNRIHLYTRWCHWQLHLNIRWDLQIATFSTIFNLFKIPIIYLLPTTTIYFSIRIFAQCTLGRLCDLTCFSPIYQHTQFYICILLTYPFHSHFYPPQPLESLKSLLRKLFFYSAGFRKWIWSSRCP